MNALPATRALYHEDGTRLTFQARVIAVEGNEVALDATAFYPESGGQSADTGVLRWGQAEVGVKGTRKDRGTGVIWHRLGGTPPDLHADVHGAVDPGTRWRHMQRHSGEHLLAQAFVRVNPAFQVVSVNMTHPECTLNLLGAPTDADVLAAEQLLRETLGRTDLILHTPTVPETELGRYPLRRETKVRGLVRLVIFQDGGGVPFEVSACGGTHVPRASQCAPVTVLRTERVGGGQTRVVFMAGEEASARLSATQREARQLAQRFSVPPERLTERVQALQAELQEQSTALNRALHVGAATAVQVAPPESLAGVTFRAVPVDGPSWVLPTLAATHTGELLAAVSPDGRCGVASARPDVHAGDLLRRALATTGGKGGGKADLAQGNSAAPGAFLQAVRDALTGG